MYIYVYMHMEEGTEEGSVRGREKDGESEQVPC